MSKETLEWLNTRTLVGFVDKRGAAWHNSDEAKGSEDNHYADAIPVEDVKRRLFDWAPAEGVVSSVYTAPSGDRIPIVDSERKAIIRPAGTFGDDDQGAILGVFKSGYTVHGYEEWLLDNVAKITGQGLSIGSAGLLKGGAVAWVQVEVPETIDTPEGVSFRPFVSAATSLDGSLASTYQRGAQVIVCDNTLSASLGEGIATRIKIKHSAKSLKRVDEVRDILGLIVKTQEAFAGQVRELCQVDVTAAQWDAFLSAHVEILDAKGEVKTGRGLTLATNKRDALNLLWNNDNRVTPWRGTAFGVVQAVNTYEHHIGNVRGASRGERNAYRAITGGADTLDNSTLDTLSKVLISA